MPALFWPERPGLTYDVLVIDAYSSDSVPVHLTTLEAIELYMERLNRDGILVFHISNRYYDIDRPLARAAERLGLESRIQYYKGNVEDDPGDYPSTRGHVEPVRDSAWRPGG